MNVARVKRLKAFNFSQMIFIKSVGKLKQCVNRWLTKQISFLKLKTVI